MRSPAGVVDIDNNMVQEWMLKPLSVEQLRLMDTSVEDLLEEYKITPAIATDWHKRAPSI